MTDAKNPKMHVDLMFPSLYLKAAEFMGKDVPLTIHRVRTESMRMQDNTKKDKYVVDSRKPTRCWS